MKTVLITGATGFVGNMLSSRLLEGSWIPRGAIRSDADMERLPRGMEAVSVGSIGPGTDWSKALEGVDTVVHLAAAVPGTGEDADGKDIFHDVNVLGSKILAETAASYGVRRIIFLSSIEVNGSVSGDKPFTEEDRPNPQTLYGVSKMEAEGELMGIADATGLQVVIIRTPFIYGPGKLGNLMNLIKSLVNRRLPLPLGSIANRRSFVYIENLLDAIIFCCDSEKAAGNIFFVSDGEAVSTPELVMMMAAGLRVKPRLISFPVNLLKIVGKAVGRGSAIRLLTDSYSVDSSKIQQVVGWKNPYSIQEGISASLNSSANFVEG
ncbi:MAG: NAD-dependent epimerase/dehydratase family protein [Thermoleophilia bacterium]